MRQTWHGRTVAGGRVANDRAGYPQGILKPNIASDPIDYYDDTSVLYSNDIQRETTKRKKGKMKTLV